jgi:hypothetical protein
LAIWPEELSMRIDRTADEPAAVHAQQHWQPARLGLDVVDLARLGCQVTPALVVLRLALDPGGRPAEVEIRHGPGFLAGHVTLGSRRAPAADERLKPR